MIIPVKNTITIEIDANADRIRIDRIELPCKYPHQVKDILEEIFNRIIDTDGELLCYVSLDYVDEDTRKNIGEW